MIQIVIKMKLKNGSVLVHLSKSIFTVYVKNLMYLVQLLKALRMTASVDRTFPLLNITDMVGSAMFVQKAVLAIKKAVFTAQQV